MTSRYVIFGFDSYDAGGGWNDIVGLADTLEAALEIARKRRDDCFQIVDTSTTPPSLVRAGTRGELCEHRNTHVVRERESPRVIGIIASGQFIVPGRYCRDCGTRLGDA